MARRKTSFLAGHYYHVYNRGNNRHPIFFERENYLFFLKQTRYYLTEETADLLAYCLMPNHYHFLVYLRQDNLSEKMAFLSLSYTKAINKRFQRCGSVFQGPFKAIHVNQEAYLLNLSRYIHLNPVKAGLAQRAEEWEFSSYRDYIGLRQGTLPQLSLLQQQIETAQVYQSFVESSDTLVDTNVQNLMVDA
jgi:putative transposase